MPRFARCLIVVDGHGARNCGIGGVDVVLKPACRSTGHPHNSSQRDAFEKQSINRRFCSVTAARLGWGGDKLATAVLTHPLGLSGMNRPIFDHVCSLATWARHRLVLPAHVGIPMQYATITTVA